MTTFSLDIALEPPLFLKNHILPVQTESRVFGTVLGKPFGIPSCYCSAKNEDLSFAYRHPCAVVEELVSFPIIDFRLDKYPETSTAGRPDYFWYPETEGAATLTWTRQDLDDDSLTPCFQNPYLRRCLSYVLHSLSELSFYSWNFKKPSDWFTQESHVVDLYYMNDGANRLGLGRSSKMDAPYSCLTQRLWKECIYNPIRQYEYEQDSAAINLDLRTFRYKVSTNIYLLDEGIYFQCVFHGIQFYNRMVNIFFPYEDMNEPTGPWDHEFAFCDDPRGEELRMHRIWNASLCLPYETGSIHLIKRVTD